MHFWRNRKKIEKIEQKIGDNRTKNRTKNRKNENIEKMKTSKKVKTPKKCSLENEGERVHPNRTAAFKHMVSLLACRRATAATAATPPTPAPPRWRPALTPSETLPHSPRPAGRPSHPALVPSAT